MLDKICNWLLRRLTKNKRAVLLSPLQFQLALISQQNGGTSLVDMDDVFVIDSNGNIHKAIVRRAE